MPTFVYKAKDRTGNIVNGDIDADDTRAAVGKIREMGYWPISLSQQKGTGPAESSAVGMGSPIWTGVSVRSLVLFFRQLATMLQAGMSLSESLDSLSRQKGIGRLPGVAAWAAEHIRSGGMLSDVMARYPYIFSSMQIGLIRAGERGGMLDSMIERTAAYLERELELRRKFSKITFYPKIIFVFIIAAVVFVPNITDIVNNGWPVVFHLLLSQVLPLALILAAVYVVIKTLLAIPPFRVAWDGIKISFPILGTVSRKLAMARFSTALSVSYAAGISLGDAIELSSGALGNELLRRAIVRSIPQIRAGGQLSEALRRAGGVPDMVLGMVTTGEKTGSLDLVLDKVTEYYNTEAETTIEKAGYILFVGLLVLAAIAVCIIVLRFYLEYAHGALGL